MIGLFSSVINHHHHLYLFR